MPVDVVVEDFDLLHHCRPGKRELDAEKFGESIIDSLANLFHHGLSGTTCTSRSCIYEGFLKGLISSMMNDATPSFSLATEIFTCYFTKLTLKSG